MSIPVYSGGYLWHISLALCGYAVLCGAGISRLLGSVQSPGVRVGLLTVVFGWIEHRRVVKGPWVVSFAPGNESPVIFLNQSALGIRDVRIIFREATAQTNSVQVIEFSQARAVPFDVPLGQCVFQDTSFLPGTVTFEMFGHQIQLMPRVLTIDGVERPWRSVERIELRGATNSKPK